METFLFGLLGLAIGFVLFLGLPVLALHYVPKKCPLPGPRELKGRPPWCTKCWQHLEWEE